MSLRSYHDAVAWAENQRLHPSQNWTGLCQKFARSTVNAAPFGGTALDAWHSRPNSAKVFNRAVAGGLGYFGTHEPGHAVFVVGNSYCYSTDILRQGKVDKVPIALITQRWGLPFLGTLIAVPEGKLNLAPSSPTVHLSHLQAAAKLDPPAPQGHVTYPAEVILVERTLAKLGYLGGQWVDGSFGTESVKAYARFQASVKSGTYSGIPTLTDLQALGRRGGFSVVYP